MNGRYRESGNPIFLFLEFNQKISAKVITLDIILGIAKIHMVVYASCIFFITDIATLYQSECTSVAGLTYLSQLNFIRHFEVKTFSEYLDASSVPLYFAADALNKKVGHPRRGFAKTIQQLWLFHSNWNTENI